MEMQVTPAFWVIPALAAVMTALLLAGVKRGGGAVGPLAALAVLWWALTGALAGVGLLARFDVMPPPLLPFMVACLLGGVWLGRSKAGGRLTALPLWVLVLSQAFRLPLELAMHQAAVDGVMPVELSFGGYNFDIVTGASAVVVALVLRAGGPRWLAWAWNLIGIAALTVIVVIALLTSPVVHAFGNDPAHLNTWVTALPYVWLPAILVLLAVAGHVVVTRKLLAG